MKKTSLKLISFFLIAIMLSTSFGVSATALDDTLTNSTPITIGDTIEVPSLSNLLISPSKNYCYNFSVDKTGYYNFENLVTSSITRLVICWQDENSELISDLLFLEYEYLIYLEKDKTYYITIYNYVSPYEQNTKSTTCFFDIEYLGEITDVRWAKTPDKDLYIMEYDIFTLDYFYNTYFSDQYTLEEYLDIWPENENGIIYFEIDGFEFEIFFSSGASLIFDNNGPLLSFDYDYILDDPVTIGTNTICIKLDEHNLYFDFEVIENPVERIEINNLPELEKLYIDFATFFLSGMELVELFESIPPIGAEIAIYYKDGSVETVPIDESYNYYHNGYHIFTWAQIVNGKCEFTVEYLGREASYSFEYELVGSLKRVSDILSKIMEIFFIVFQILQMLSF